MRCTLFCKGHTVTDQSIRALPMGAVNNHCNGIIQGVSLGVGQQAREEALHLKGHSRGGSRLRKLREFPMHYICSELAHLMPSCLLHKIRRTKNFLPFQVAQCTGGKDTRSSSVTMPLSRLALAPSHWTKHYTEPCTAEASASRTPSG